MTILKIKTEIIAVLLLLGCGVAGLRAETATNSAVAENGQGHLATSVYEKEQAEEGSSEKEETMASQKIKAKNRVYQRALGSLPSGFFLVGVPVFFLIFFYVVVVILKDMADSPDLE